MPLAMRGNRRKSLPSAYVCARVYLTSALLNHNGSTMWASAPGGWLETSLDNTVPKAKTSCKSPRSVRREPLIGMLRFTNVGVDGIEQ